MDGARGFEIAIGVSQPYHLSIRNRHDVESTVSEWNSGASTSACSMTIPKPEKKGMCKESNQMANKYWELYNSVTKL
ncbi:hypothetical protein GQ457_05G035000 [Hibiscus cannabinus]